MSGWVSREVLAWTGHDGPGRPPQGSPRVLAAGLALALVVVFGAVLVTDTLCPEHQAWIDGLAVLSLLTGLGAALALVRRWAVAGQLALSSALGGVAMGIIDAEHDPTRGWVIAALFAAVAAAALVVAGSGLRLRRWDRQVLGGAREDGAARDRAAMSEAEAGPAPSAPVDPARPAGRAGS